MWVKVLIGLVVVLNAASDDGAWKFLVKYDTPFNLTCQNTVNWDSSGKTLAWILPNGDLVDQHEPIHERVEFHQHGQLLRIKSLDDIDFGNYFCYIYDSRSAKAVVLKKGINVDGPFWGDLSAKYKKGIIIGSIAASIVFVLMIGICYLFERHPVLIGRDSKVMGEYVECNPPIETKLQESNAYDNGAMEMEETIKKADDFNGTSPPNYSLLEDVKIIETHNAPEENPNTHL